MYSPYFILWEDHAIYHDLEDDYPSLGLILTLLGTIRPIYFRPFIGVVTPFTIGRGPPCRLFIMPHTPTPNVINATWFEKNSNFPQVIKVPRTICQPRLLLVYIYLHDYRNNISKLESEESALKKHIPNKRYKSSCTHLKVFILSFLQQKIRWWFQPNWKILVKLDHFPRYGWKFKKYLQPPPRKTCLINIPLFTKVFDIPSRDSPVLYGFAEPPRKETAKPTNQPTSTASSPVPRYERQRVESKVSHTSPATPKSRR